MSLLPDKSKLFISKSNKIIDAQYKLNAREQKLILYMATKIRPDDTDFDFYEVKITEIIDILSTSGKKSGNIHQELVRICQSLNKKPIRVRNENGSETLINWVASVDYHPGRGIISFEFSKRLKPYLLNLSAHFTRYSFEYFAMLSSTYSIRFYEILKRHQFKTPPKFTIGLDELKSMLGIDDMYSEYRYFKKRVLKCAEKELSEKTDIFFTYDEHRVSRKVTSLTFHIYENKNRKKEDKKAVEVQTSLFIDDDIYSNETVNRLIEVGMKRENAKSIFIKGFEIVESDEERENARNQFANKEAYINSKIDLLEYEHRRVAKNNPQGFLIKALKSNYLNEELNILQKRKKADKKEKEKQLKRREIEIQLQTLRKARYEQETQIMNELFKSMPNIIEKIGKEYGVQSQLSYDFNESFEKNYERASIKAFIDAKIKEKYADKFSKIRNEFNPRIDELQRNLDKL